MDNDSLHALLDRLRAGDSTAADALIEQSVERLRRLARKMLREDPRVRRWNDTDDVLQNACVRLHRAMRAKPPTDASHFFRLASMQIRRELIDLAKHHYGPQGHGAHHASDPALPGGEGGRPPLYEDADPTDGPKTLLRWTSMHEYVEKLSEKERDVFELMFYHGLTQEQVAQTLGVDVRTVKRRWRDAKITLKENCESPLD